MRARAQKKKRTTGYKPPALPGLREGGGPPLNRPLPKGRAGAGAAQPPETHSPPGGSFDTHLGLDLDAIIVDRIDAHHPVVVARTDGGSQYAGAVILGDAGVGRPAVGGTERVRGV